MDIWEELYMRAKKEYHPEDVTPFVYGSWCIAFCNLSQIR